jgi:hypothetical protein
MKAVDRVCIFVAAWLFLVLAPISAWAKPLVLFDDGHAQTAGNADWVIKGGFSDFADAFKAQGCDVRAVSRMSADSLKGASVLVLPEPNTMYSADEEKAIVDFVMNGGHLYAIADHDNSDRNGDGVDSVDILNRFLPKLGLEVEHRYFSEAPTGGTIYPTPFTRNVTAVGTWGGTSIKLLGPNAEAHITMSVKNGGGAYIASNIVGKGGKVIAMGDSSPYDDGTGDPRDKLHNGYTNPKFQHDTLAENTIKWLLDNTSTTAPGESLRRMINDLSEAHSALQEKHDENLLQFVETCETGIVTLIQEHPEQAAFLAEAGKADPALNGLMQNLIIQETFNRLHAH